MQDHFKPTYWLIVGLAIAVIGYQFCISFLPIPKENIRLVDTGQGILLGSVLTAGISWLIGGSPSLKKTPPTGTTTADISATITQEEKKEG
ncbi:hypothetical protein DCC81_11905 [Chitinophaga parva]|uniref:Uncharacterized protein n=1 Tax=Chitinophaga parva TaxID=2169414 RepID=A0A2T7BFE6_9BACT|nr:hypothetical protein [Chitinophaga parva]PUZ25011.1 hypothetical protein DCC81_11905 [Chitinophaga parva]